MSDDNREQEQKQQANDAEELVNGVPKKYKSYFAVGNWVRTFYAVILVVTILWQFIDASCVLGDSMLPNYRSGDLLLLWHYKYEPEYGDVVVVTNSANGKVLIKRVIGLPGDEIIVSDFLGVVYRNGEPLEEDYLEEGTFTGAGETYGIPIIVPENCVYVLGDNREVSLDSRYAEVGCLSQDDIRGTPILKIPNILSLFD